MITRRRVCRKFFLEILSRQREDIDKSAEVRVSPFGFYEFFGRLAL